MPATAIDPALYVTPPRVTVRSGLSLSKMLLRVVPKDAGPGVAVSAKALWIATCELDEKWKASNRTRDVRPLDVRLERLWSVVESSLARYAVLRAHKAMRQFAGALHEELFCDGLGFLELGDLELHAESARRIQLIEDDGLLDGLRDLVGPELVDELHAAHREYGEALGIAEASPDSSPDSGTEAGAETSPDALVADKQLLESLRTVRRAIGSYALQVVAFAGVDPSHAAAARQALAPIDQFRAASRRAAARGDGDGGDGALPENAPDPDDAVPEPSLE
ncbi:hypothetical protein [Paraliomyxa miuraensis]|uniref:hypothetical protein n=1 Tax=Paraliomyxa miuraensis TaxID=376150 RepID=UPI00225BFDC2|nr:hypothetical protein [Paraliomyxa miuraensis]MCX4239324.1 hypothetical protein [Paraliomyxa miuraensis]